MEQTAQQSLELKGPPGVVLQRACYPALAISVRQPWAWLILHAGKDIENRTWLTRFRGRVAIHASKGMTFAEYDDACQFADGIRPDLVFPTFNMLQRGGIIGEVNIVDCVTASESPWFAGEYGFVLRDAKELPFLPCKGSLGFFKPDNESSSPTAASNTASGGHNNKEPNAK
jgi:hypothetical protein